MIRDIVMFPDPRLKEECDPIESVTDEVRALLDDMAETMYAADGIGLAAPQVGELIRAIVIDLGADEQSGRTPKRYDLINPVLLERSGDTEYDEGCLSIPGIRETVKRSARVVVEALDRNGERYVIDADGLLAICLQHEIDHINGILFLDRIGSAKRELLRPKLRELVDQYALKSQRR